MELLLFLIKEKPQQVLDQRGLARLGLGWTTNSLS
jgi:hypothetical protein